MLCPERPPLTQIADALEANGRLFDEIHIVAHGLPGTLLFGGCILTPNSLTAYQADLARIANCLTPDGAIALTACHVAAGPDGAALLAACSAATGRRVFGTDTLVGAGNAESFTFSGPCGLPSPFPATARAAYAATLAPPVFFYPAIQLSDVEAGVGGFVINGVTDTDRSGYSVSIAGDVNGDGLADVIVGADGSDPNGADSGASYVVFGKSDGLAIELSDVAAGAGGFAISGINAGDLSGKAVSSAGDVNGDGLVDLIIGAQAGDANGIDSGASYVVFGKSDGTTVELSDVDSGTGGFAINGEAAYDLAGRSVSNAGDVNGDGLADLIVGAVNAGPNGGESGASFVVFGKSDGTAVELSDVDAGTGGFAINGAAAYDHAGVSVSTAGDVNGDGLDDLIVGAWSDDPNGLYSGASFVVFGKSDGTSIELSDVEAGTGGFAINGGAAFNLAGWSVSDAGDVNGDGLDDLIVGAFADDPNGPASGSSYVVFGKSDGTSIELSDVEAGTGGFAITGVSANDQSGFAVSAGGDVNGDGLDDVIVGAYRDDPNGTDSGAAFVVFGKTDGAAVALSTVETGIGGFAMHGVSAGDLAGASVGGGGDVNNDGLDDLVVGAFSAAPNGALSGASYVVYGKAAIDLVASSDTGVSDVDNVTGDRTPTIAFATEAGVTVEIDWGDGNGFVPASSAGTGAVQQETLGSAYFSNGTKTIQVRATNGLAEQTVETLEIRIVSLATPGDDFIDLSFSTRNEEVSGLAGDDTILTGSGDDILRGNAGDDILGGGPGADRLFGGSGINTATYFNATTGLTADLILNGNNTGDAAGDSYSSIQNLTGTEFDDILWGNFAANTINGLGGNDLLFGRQGDDTLNGGTGDDVLNGGAGADGLFGGAGTNTASYTMASGPLTVDLVVTANNTGEAAGDTYSQIQNLTGSVFSDELSGTFTDNVIQGGSGWDFLRGRSGNDTLLGDAGNDTLDGGADADVLDGGAGINTAYYFSSAAGLTVDLTNSANNTGDAAGDTYINIQNVQGSGFADSLTGNASSNSLIGNNGDDFLSGLGGIDSLFGQAGNDLMDGGAGGDMFFGGAGTNTVTFASASAGVVADLIVVANNTGDAAGDVYSQVQNLTGSGFGDTLRGTFAANVLDGGDGDDVMLGRGGGDTYTGGNGNDLFRFQNGFGSARITDFDALTPLEKIDLRAITGITDFGDLVNNHLTQAGANAIISDGAGQILLENVQITDLDIQDFLIVGLSPVDLIAAADTGSSTTDNLTSDSTSTVEFTTDPGVSVMINWDDGNGFVPAATVGTGLPQQETLAVAYAVDGVKNIQVQATGPLGIIYNQSLAITIDSVADLSALDLTDASDDGPSNSDNISGDITPTIEFTAEAGALVEVDWGAGNGFVPGASTGTGAPQQETLATPYGVNGLKTIQVRITDTAGNQSTQALDITTVGVGVDILNGGAASEQMFGYTGNDEFLVRFGNDTANGGDGADLFKFDGRYVNNGDAHTIADLDFAEGDTMLFRFFDTGAFDDFVDPGNPLAVTNSGATATMDSLADIVEAHFNGILQASDSGDGDTLLTIPSGANQMTVELDGVLFTSLNIPAGPPDLSPTDDVLVGTGADDILNGYGGNDLITMRFGNDTAIGGTGGDRFILDGRYINDGDAHTITDLNFGAGDRMEIRFMEVGTFDDAIDPVNTLRVLANGSKALFNSVDDILEMAGNGVITGADDGFGGTILSGIVGGNAFTLTLDGIDIF